jgi:hypothetical protein
MKFFSLPATVAVLLAMIGGTNASRAADWVWAPAAMLTAEELASSGALAPLPIPTKLSNFRYPFLQDDGSVVFIANDHLKPEGAEGRAGIFRIESNDRFTALTSAGEGVANSGGKVVSVIGLKVEGGRAVFGVNLDNGEEGIALWENGRTLLLASSGGPEPFTDFGYPDLSGEIAVFSASKGGAPRSLFIVDLQSADRRPKEMVPNGTAIPETEGLKFLAFANSQFADGNAAVFRAYSQDLFSDEPRGRRLGGVYRIGGEEGAKPRKIVDTDTPLPGAPSGYTFDRLESALPRNGYTAIVNRTRLLQGVYIASPDGKVDVIADTNTAIPDLFSGTFTGFSKWVSNCAPWILFLATAENYGGLFALNIDSQELYLLADSRMDFDGKKIVGAEISNSAKIGEKVALMLQFSDGTSGVYLATFGKGLAMRKSPSEG